MSNYVFTSESVSEGHPDKVADQISDGVLDAYLKQDPLSRVACETMITKDLLVIGGEVTSKAKVNIEEVSKNIVKDIGYTSEEEGFDINSCKVIVSLNSQSPDIALGVDAKTQSDGEQGAGDQGLMFGYANVETKEYMPLSISLSHQLVKKLAKMRKSKVVNFLRPDSKSQVSVEYADGQIKRIESIVLSTQHNEEVDQKQIVDLVRDQLIPSVVPKELIDNNTHFFINPTGRFVVGGPKGDCGLTGRKIIVDTYGGHGSHGGGAFSGKDLSKVDRSASYAARHIAKNIVAAGLAKKCLIQLSYAIGVAAPVSLMLQTYGTATVSENLLAKAVQEVWDLKPSSIITFFDLLKPRYLKTAAYGHFGRSEPEFSWELLNKVEELKDRVKHLQQQ
ncbi:MAG: methionine adenosyltransferase [Bdellovibrionaceae bacterium]|nr:methionine adenosyltransferase [Pseudobdellovibrionaceae bacterium]